MKRSLPFLSFVFMSLVLIGCTTANPGDTTQAEDLPESTSSEPVSYTAAEVAEHNTRNDCWTINSGKVYDITSFINLHPGGADAISQACGRDSTELFAGVDDHEPRGAPAQLSQFQIGVLVEE